MFRLGLVWLLFVLLMWWYVRYCVMNRCWFVWVGLFVGNVVLMVSDG